MDTLEILRDCVLFEDLDQSTLEQLQRQAETQRFAKDEVLFLEMSEGNEVFLILDGEVEIDLRLANADTNLSLITLGPGKILGEICFVDAGPRSATATARTDVSALVWKCSDWHEFCESNPEQGYRLAMGVARLLSRRLRRWGVHMLNQVSWGLE